MTTNTQDTVQKFAAELYGTFKASQRSNGDTFYSTDDDRTNDLVHKVHDDVFDGMWSDD